MKEPILRFLDDSEIKLNEPILTITREGDAYREIIIHRTESELEAIITSDGLYAGYAFLALEILRLRRKVNASTPSASPSPSE